MRHWVLLIALVLSLLLAAGQSTLDDDEDWMDDKEEEEEVVGFKGKESVEDGAPEGTHPDHGTPDDEHRRQRDKANAIEPPTLAIEGTLGMVLVLFVIKWWTGSKENERIATSFAMTIERALEKHFTRLGWGEKATRTARNGASYCEPLLYKDGNSFFQMYATGRKGVLGCLITLRLRHRENLFYSLMRLVWEQHDIVTFELLLDTMEKPFVASVFCGSDAEKDLRSACPEIARFVMGDKEMVHETVAQHPSFKALKMSFHHSLQVLAEVPDVVKPSAGLFTAKVMQALDHCAWSGIFRYLHVSDQVVTLEQKLWQMTDAYKASVEQRARTATGPLPAEGVPAIVLSLRLPHLPSRQRYYPCDVALLTTTLLYLVEHVHAIPLCEAKAAKLLRKRTDLQAKEWDEIVKKRTDTARREAERKDEKKGPAPKDGERKKWAPPKVSNALA